MIDENLEPYCEKHGELIEGEYDAEGNCLVCFEESRIEADMDD